MRKLFTLLMIAFATSLMAADINWAKDFKSGLETAQKLDRPVLFVYSRHTCKYCVMLDETTFKDKKVIDGLNKDFVSIISYSDENDFTPADLVRGATPTIWFLLPNGKPMYQPIAGALDSTQFLKALDIVSKAYVQFAKD